MWDRSPMTTHEFAIYMVMCAVVVGVFYTTGVAPIGYLIPVGLSIFAITGRVYTLQHPKEKDEDQNSSET